MPAKGYRKPLDQILTQKITRTETCWLWTGAKSHNGYAHVWVPDRKTSVRAHRLMYELFIGPIHEGLTLDHLCGVRHCVNPAHLEPVTRAENARRAYAEYIPKVLCKRGHPRVTTKDGRRFICPTCRRKAGQRRRQELRRPDRPRTVFPASQKEGPVTSDA